MYHVSVDTITRTNDTNKRASFKFDDAYEDII